MYNAFVPLFAFTVSPVLQLFTLSYFPHMQPFCLLLAKLYFFTSESLEEAREQKAQGEEDELHVTSFLSSIFSFVFNFDSFHSNLLPPPPHCCFHTTERHFLLN